MGLCVVDPDGGSPLKRWGSLINFYKGGRFREVAKQFVLGEPVQFIESQVQIAFSPVSDRRLRVTVRNADPTEECHLLIVDMESLDDHSCHSCAGPDARGLGMVPNGWITGVEDASAEWELYNCRIRSMRPSQP